MTTAGPLLTCPTWKYYSRRAEACGNMQLLAGERSLVEAAMGLGLIDADLSEETIEELEPPVRHLFPVCQNCNMHRIEEVNRTAMVSACGELAVLNYDPALPICKPCREIARGSDDDPGGFLCAYCQRVIPHD